jgi:hypothetical protein
MAARIPSSSILNKLLACSAPISSPYSMFSAHMDSWLTHWPLGSARRPTRAHPLSCPRRLRRVTVL